MGNPPDYEEAMRRRASQVPAVPTELLKYLQNLFPDRAQGSWEDTREKVLWRAGQVSVVRLLEQMHKKQQVN